MKILMHMCCAPCAVFPVRLLRDAGMDVTGFFFNHNIHPYQEYRRRLDTVSDYARQENLQVIIVDDYRLEEFLGNVAGKPEERCRYCYASRLDKAAEAAAAGGFPAFSSSLLYSKYQKHDLIHDLGLRAGEKFGVRFHYEDFRSGWQEGIRLSKAMEMYRQQYCGCIYSEKERYLRMTKPCSD